jgi:hypothetical protein
MAKNNWLLSFAFLLGVFVIMQLYLLTNVGTKGQELSDIRNQQNEIKIENEILKAKILELRSNKVVLEGLAYDDELQQKELRSLDPDALSISAMN